MIKNPDIPLTEFPIVLDIGRPDSFCEKDHTDWAKLHSFVKECDFEIGISNAFYFIEEMLHTNQNYGGGGFKYCFWFRDHTQHDIFVNKLVELFGLHAIAVLDERNQSFKYEGGQE